MLLLKLTHSGWKFLVFQFPKTQSQLKSLRR